MNPTKYSTYTTEDFVEDPTFRKWVLDPDPNLNRFWQKWLLNHQEKRDAVRIAREIVLTVRYQEFEWDEQRKRKIWEAIESGTEIKGEENPDQTKVRPIFEESVQRKYLKNQRKNTFSVLLKYAAVLTGIILVSTLLFQLKDQDPRSEKKEMTLIKKSNPKGQKSKIFLPDGSVVYLNAASHITYPSRFSSNKRQIQLVGEAFFEVAKDSLRPFTVASGGMLITALGTSFNVRAYEESSQASVALITGKVKVQQKDSTDHSLMLTPGEGVRLNLKEGHLVKHKVNYEEAILWKEGILYFNEVPLKEAFRRLENWYGVSFTIAGEMEPVSVTGKFDHEYLSNVLRSLSYTAGFKYLIKDDQVYISNQ